MLSLKPMDKNEQADFLSSGEPETFEYFKANVSEGFDNSTVGVALDSFKEHLASTPDLSPEQIKENERAFMEGRKPVLSEESKKELATLTKAQYQKSPYFREGVEFQDGWSERRAKYLADSYDARKVREQTIAIGSESDKTLFGSGIAGQMVGGLPDPINLIPFGAGFKKASLVSKLGAAAFEGAIGNVAVSAVTRPYYEKRGVDSDWQDYANDVWMGAGMGGMFAGGGHVLSMRKAAKLENRQKMGVAADSALEAMAKGDELDLNSKLPAFNEEIRKMRELPDLMKTEEVQSRVAQLEELGYSPEEASDNMAIMASQAEFFSAYNGKEFEANLADIQAARVEGGQIVPVSSEELHVERMLDSEILNMKEEVAFAEKGGQKIFNDGQYVSTTGKGTFPAWYGEAGIKNKAQLEKVIEAKRGPVYERLKSIAETRLMDGYESPAFGQSMPDAEFKKLRMTAAEKRKSGVLTPQKEFPLPESINVVEIQEAGKFQGTALKKGEFINAHTNEPIKVTGKSIGKINSFIKDAIDAGRGPVAENIGRVTTKIQELIENSVYIEKQVKDAKGREFKHFESSVILNGKEFMVQLQVDKGELYNIKVEKMRGGSFKNAFTSSPNRVFTDSPTGRPKPIPLTQTLSEFREKLNSARSQNEHYQGVKTKPKRGAYQSFSDKSVISLFKDADRSTFIHETGHHILKNLTDLADFGNPMAKADLATLKKAFPQAKTFEDLHEYFARGFERYLMEGKAPNRALEGVFSRFKDWLTSLYKTVDKLNSPINDDVRAIYSKILGEKVDTTPTRAPEVPAAKFNSEADLDKAVNETEAAILEAKNAGASDADLDVLKEALEEISAEERAIDEAFTLFQSGKNDLDAAARAAGVSKSTMQEIIDAFNDKLLVQAGEKIDAVRAAEVANELKKALAIEAKELKRQAYLSGIAKSETLSVAKKLLESGMDARASILAQIEGDSAGRGIEGAGNSLDGNYKALSQSTLSKMHSELKAIDPNIENMFENVPDFNENVLVEMMQIRADGTGKVGITNDPHAVKAAEILSRFAEQHRERANLAGARIGKLDGWTPRTHDVDKIIGKGESAWISFMRESLDLEKSFRGLEGDSLTRALYETYQNIITGVRKEHGEIDTAQPVRKSPRNVAKKLGEQRVLHFKDAQSELRYLKEFGQGSNVLQTMTRHLDNTSRRIALMEKFGPNPDSTLSSVIENIRQDIRDKKLFPEMSDADRKIELDRLGDKNKVINREGAIGKAVMFMMGEGTSFEHPRLKYFAQMVRALNGVSKLGSATLSQFSDFSLMASRRRVVSGDNFASAWLDMTTSYLKGASPELKEKVLDHLGVLVDGINFANFNRFDADNINNRLSRWNDKLMRWSGQEWHTRRAKSSVALSLAKELGSNINKSWDKLDDGIRNSLTQYGSFNKQKWDLLKKVAAEEVDGAHYFHPDLIDKIDLAEFEKLIPEEFQVKNRPAMNETLPIIEGEVPKEIRDWEAKRDYHLKREKFKLETDLRTFIIEETRSAVLEPDAKVRRLTSLGTKSGTITGEAARMLMQFKSFSFAYYDRAIRGQSMMKDSKDYGGVFQHAVASFLLGYVSTVAKDLAKGLEPADPQEGKTWGRAFFQSGGLGIMGDFLQAGISSRSGADALATLAGPTVSTAANALNLAGKTAREPFKDSPDMEGIVSDWVDLGRSVTPFSTLWYTRAAQDYLIWMNLKEALEPGSIRRSERRLKKEYNQQYLYRP